MTEKRSLKSIAIQFIATQAPTFDCDFDGMSGTDQDQTPRPDSTFQPEPQNNQE